MTWIEKHKRTLIIVGIILLLAFVVFLFWFFSSRKHFGTENPMNKDPKNYSRDDFFKSVLSGLGVPVSDTNVSSLKTWAQYEGGTASFNPLNTTKTMNKGETNFNSAGVKNYPDFETGIDATIATLKLSYYKPIVNALLQQQTSWKGNSDIVASLRTWGTVNYANYLA